MSDRRTAGARGVRVVLALVCAVLAAAATATSPMAADAGAAPRPGATATRAASPDGSCADPQGVTVVVDFQQLGGGVHVRCAASPVATGFDALDRAGIAYQTTTRSPGFLCRIAGVPSNDPCVVPSPATAYWSYWLASRGGQWCYSNLGAGNRQPPPGTVEGWSFSLSSDGSTAPPPGIAVPAALPGSAPPALGVSDCDTSGAPPSPAPDATDDGGAVAPGGAPTGPATGGVPTNEVGGSDSAGPEGVDVPAPSAAPGSTSTPGDEGSPTTSAPAADVGGSPTTTTGGAPSDATDAERDTDAESEEAGGMDLRGTSTRGTGSALGVVVAVTLIGALGAGAVLIGRRARRD